MRRSAYSVPTDEDIYNIHISNGFVSSSLMSIIRYLEASFSTNILIIASLDFFTPRIITLSLRVAIGARATKALIELIEKRCGKICMAHGVGLR